MPCFEIRVQMTIIFILWTIRATSVEYNCYSRNSLRNAMGVTSISWSRPVSSALWTPYERWERQRRLLGMFVWERNRQLERRCERKKECCKPSFHAIQSVLGISWTGSPIFHLNLPNFDPFGAPILRLNAPISHKHTHTYTHKGK